MSASLFSLITTSIFPAYSENCAARWSLLASCNNRSIWLSSRLRLHTSGLCGLCCLRLRRDVKNRRRWVISGWGLGSCISWNCCSFSALGSRGLIHSCKRWISVCLEHDLSKERGMTWWKYDLHGRCWNSPECSPWLSRCGALFNSWKQGLDFCLYFLVRGRLSRARAWRCRWRRHSCTSRLVDSSPYQFWPWRRFPCLAAQRGRQREVRQRAHRLHPYRRASNCISSCRTLHLGYLLPLWRSLAPRQPQESIPSF